MALFDARRVARERVIDPRLQRGALSEVDRMAHDRRARLERDFARAIARAVVDDDDSRQIFVEAV